MPKKNEPIPVPLTEKAKRETMIRSILFSILAGLVIGSIAFFLIQSHKIERCAEVAVVVQSFDVCLERVQGCFFDAEDVLRVGKAIRYKKEHCD